MRLPRFRLRTLIAGVAVAALGLGVLAELLNRRARYLALAAPHASFSVAFHPETKPEEKARLSRLMNWHAGFYEKYRRAADCPWLAVMPEPPMPK